MDRRDALRVLIEHSFLLTDDQKKALVEKLPLLSDDEVNTLGTFLALEKQKSLEANEGTMLRIDDILQKLETEN